MQIFKEKKWLLPLLISIVACIGISVWDFYFRTTDDPAPFPTGAVVYEDKYYFIMDTHDSSISCYGLPFVITDDMIGPCVGQSVGKDGKGANYFYTYLPAGDSQCAVYITYKSDKYKPDGEYGYAVLHDYVKTEAYHTITAKQRLSLYGIQNGEDIASVSANGIMVDGIGIADRLFIALAESTPITADEFKKLEEPLDPLNTEIIEVSITAKSGLVVGRYSFAYFPDLNLFWWEGSFYLVPTGTDF